MSVVEDFDYWRGKPDLAVAVAAIKALTAVIKRSKATTMMGLEIELKRASEELKVSAYLETSDYIETPANTVYAFWINILDTSKHKSYIVERFLGAESWTALNAAYNKNESDD